MPRATFAYRTYKLMREYAGVGYNPTRETYEQGAIRGALELARASYALEHDPDLFMVWELDDIDSTFYDKDAEPTPLYQALLCRDCDHEHAHVIRGYDPRDGIFERGGQIVGSLGGIDVTPPHPYARVVEAELYSEWRHESAHADLKQAEDCFLHS